MTGVAVTGFTSARMLQIEQSAIVSGFIQGDSLVLRSRGGQEILAGNVRGIQGIKGDPGGVPDATNSGKGGIRLAGNIGGNADTPKVTGALEGTVDASLAKASTPNNDGWGGGSPTGITMTLREMVHQIQKSMYDLQKTLIRTNRTTNLWSGTTAEYNAVSTAEKSAPGFIAVIIE